MLRPGEAAAAVAAITVGVPLAVSADAALDLALVGEEGPVAVVIGGVDPFDDVGAVVVFDDRVDGGRVGAVAVLQSSSSAEKEGDGWMGWSVILECFWRE